jgi:putative peptide zinc metalloprotease protein
MVSTTKAWPEIRNELALHQGPRAPDGSPTWTLHDPVVHRYFRLGPLEFEYIQRWNLADPAAIAESIRRETPFDVEPEDVEAFRRFLEDHQLARPKGPESSADLARRRAAGRPGFWRWLLHNYLFLRIPLLQPDPWLRKATPWLAGLFRRWFLVAIPCVTLLALYLVSRQWTAFSHSFLYVLTPEGLLVTGGMLFLSKAVHELGHATAASHFGCRVPAMGVALILGWPVLWTDVTEAWKLPRRRDRLIIDGAGMLAELSLAGCAALLWAVLPDSPLRTGAYLLASTAWLITLAINLNPFMRFDGYYLLADWWDVPNLQERSFALARWHLREQLFGFGLPSPEPETTRHRRALIAYAYATWIYRALLFLGIAFAVYHFFFKALGLALFAVEVGWFIVRPVAREISVCGKLIRTLGLPRRPRLAWTAPILAVALLFLPWRSHLLVPGLLQAETEFVAYSPQPARVKRVPVGDGQAVAAGDVLVELESPDIDYRIAMAELRLAELRQQVSAQSVELALARHNPVDLGALQATLAELDGFRAVREQMTIRAPFAGRVRDLPDSLRTGEWVARYEMLATVTDAGTKVIAYAEEADLARLSLGTGGRFYPDGGDLPPFGVRIAAIDRTGTRQLALAELASRFGGNIAVREDGEHRLVPEQGIYRLVLQPDAGTAPVPSTIRGRLALQTPAESLAGRLLRSATAVLIRESGW